MASRRVGASCNPSLMPGATWAQRTSRPTRPAAKARKRRSACWPVTGAAGGRLAGDMASGGRPQIIVAADAEALAEIAAERLLARVTPAKERTAVCLTGGSSPEGLYRRLACQPYRSTLPWDRVHWFMGDDRFVPGDHTHSNMGMARRLFLDRVVAPANTIHAIPTDADRPDVAARRYEAELKHFYGRDQFDTAHPLCDLGLQRLRADVRTAL